MSMCVCMHVCACVCACVCQVDLIICSPPVRHQVSVIERPTVSCERFVELVRDLLNDTGTAIIFGGNSFSLGHIHTAATNFSLKVFQQCFRFLLRCNLELQPEPNTLVVSFTTKYRWRGRQDTMVMKRCNMEALVVHKTQSWYNLCL